jgi:hypothetical protein
VESLDNEKKYPDRDALQAAIEQVLEDDKSLIAKVMKGLEPLIAYAEEGKYSLYSADRLKRRRLAEVMSVSMDLSIREIELVSLREPIPWMGWMSGEGHKVFKEVAFAHAVRVSVEPWTDKIMKEAYRAYFAQGTADWKVAEELFRTVFGNRLHTAVNTSLFSGAAYPVESILIHHLAFVLTGYPSMAEKLIPLVSYLPRAIPLGVREDSRTTGIYLVA